MFYENFEIGAVKKCANLESKRILHEYLLALIGFDTADNELSKCISLHFEKPQISAIET